MNQKKANKVPTKSRKRYSCAEKVKYHTFRMHSNVGEKKKSYSKNWLDGYNDDHAKSNLSAIETEIDYRKKQKLPICSGDYGYRNGLRCRVGKRGVK